MKIFKIIALIGILLLFGTAGASDLYSISLGVILKQCAMGGAMLLFGVVGFKISEKISMKPRKTQNTSHAAFRRAA